MNTRATTASNASDPSDVPQPTESKPVADADTAASASGADAAPKAAPAATRAPQRTWSVLAWLVVLLLALAGVVLSASLWVRTNNAQSETARHVGEVMAQQREREAQVAALEAQVRELQSRLASSEARLAEFSLQRGQLEDLVRGLSRTRDESLLQDIESLVRQAMANAELSGNVQPLVAALQAGMERIARSPQPRLAPVQQAMAQDLNDLQQATVLDVPRAVAQMTALIGQVDRLPLGEPPPQRLGEVLQTLSPAPARVTDPEANAWQRLSADATWQLESWWRQGLHALEGLVRVRRVTQPDAVSLSPQEAVALTSQLKLRLLGARVALLNGQREQAAQDLAQVKDAVNAFAQLQTPAAQAVLQAIRGLSEDIARGPVPRPAKTLQALAIASNE
jgi:uroporphyrin-3 C-methyltransferase